MINVKKVFLVLIFVSSILQAHFGVLRPDSDVVTNSNKQNMKIMFMHPFEQTYMQMDRPKEFGYFLDGKKVDLLTKIKGKKIKGFQTWEYTTKYKNMGDYIYFVDPKPYFEPSEGKFIRHITKTIVDAYNAGEGWDAKTGLKAEIVPLSRPYSLYKGNLFSATVYYKGKAVPYAKVEIEYFNDTNIDAPTDNHITQVIKADKNGVFSYAMPKSGWWGFAALIEDDVTIKKDFKDYPVELGAVIWVKTYEMK